MFGSTLLLGEDKSLTGDVMRMRDLVVISASRKGFGLPLSRSSTIKILDERRRIRSTLIVECRLPTAL